MEALDFAKVYHEVFGNRTPEELEPYERIAAGRTLEKVRKHRREWGILYYEPYEALKIESTGLTDPRHAFRRVKDTEGNSVSSGRFPQAEFHKSNKKVRLIISGNQAGKTQCGAAESIWLSLAIHPCHSIPTPNRGRIVGENLNEGIMEVIWPKYDSLMPIHELRREPSKYSGGQIKKVTYKCGSTAEFMSYEMGVKPFEGWTGDWVWFDEPPPKDIFTACVRGVMRNEGLIFITSTPL
jgi:phage terminase large subunit-like protein